LPQLAIKPQFDHPPQSFAVPFKQSIHRPSVTALGADDQFFGFFRFGPHGVL